MKTRGFRFERHVRNPLGARVLARIYLGPRTSKGEGTKRKRFAGIRGRDESVQKKKKRVYICVRERERVFAREEKSCAKEGRSECANARRVVRPQEK